MTHPLCPICHNTGIIYNMVGEEEAECECVAEHIARSSPIELRPAIVRDTRTFRVLGFPLFEYEKSFDDGKPEEPVAALSSTRHDPHAETAEYPPIEGAPPLCQTRLE